MFNELGSLGSDPLSAACLTAKTPIEARAREFPAGARGATAVRPQETIFDGDSRPAPEPSVVLSRHRAAKPRSAWQDEGPRPYEPCGVRSGPRNSVDGR